MKEYFMEPKQIVVIGGVAAGASFAARVRRLNEHARIILVERGKDVSFANCGLPYYIGGEIQTRGALSVQTPETLKALLNLDVKTHTEAIRIDREKKQVYVKNIISGEDEWLDYDKLMLAPGASPRIPDVPGIHHEKILTLRNLADMDRISEVAKAGKRAVVVGAGFIGLEMAEQLHRKGLSVEVVQYGPQVLPQLGKRMAKLLENELVQHGIVLHLNDRVVRYENRNSILECFLESGTVLDADFVVLSVGVEPESRLAREAHLVLGKNGHIVVNDFMQTSDADIYAAGDVVETAHRLSNERTAVPLGGPANRQGRVAADHIFLGEKARPYPGSLGTAIVRVFGTTAGTVGWSETALEKNGRSYGMVTVNDFHHAGYYPGAKPLVLTVFWDRETDVLLGAQAAGGEGVDKRLDVMATAIAAQMTIDDLVHLELAYAPPFGSAKDIVNIAGFAATNKRDGLVDTISELPDNPDAQIIDVRAKAMADADPVAGGINIPMPALRNHLDRLDRDKPVVTVCALGKNSYFASRILKQNGFDVKSLEGGMKMMTTGHAGSSNKKDE